MSFELAEPNLIAASDRDNENTCDQCTQSLCCRYITVGIGTPRSMHDHDNLLWMVSHEGVRLYKDADGWGVQTMSNCQHLQSNGGCGIYETRPAVCRDHSNDDCEFVREEDASVLEFLDHNSLDEYCRKRFKTWDKRFNK